jgi:hypothetical protein
MSRPGTLTLRREKSEPKATYITPTKIEYSVNEYAEQLDISWQALMNDDLGKIREAPQQLAMAAARFEDGFVSALYDNAVTQATLAGLGAPWSGTGRLTVANLAIGVNAMRTRTDAQGNLIAIKKIYLVIPPILEPQKDQILKDLISYGGAASNILSSYIAGVYVDPYIATAAPNVPWYLFADPMSIPAVSVARLAGFPDPWVYMKRSDVELLMGNAPSAFQMGSFATGDIEYAVEDIIGGWNDASYGGVTDFRGIYYSSGTTP